MALRVLRLIDEYDIYSARIYGAKGPVCVPSSNTWIAPPEGILKINVDASLADVGWVGLGVVGRNSVGEVVFAVVRRVKAYWSSEIAEAKVSRWQCGLVNNMVLMK